LTIKKWASTLFLSPLTVNFTVLGYPPVSPIDPNYAIGKFY